MEQSKEAKLQKTLEKILGNHNVYYQPPETIKIKYPCIIFRRSAINTNHADNKAYKMADRYDLTVIQQKTDTRLANKLVRELPMCSFDRSYNQNNLYHEALTLYW